MWSSNHDGRVIIRTDGIRLPDGQVRNDIKENGYKYTYRYWKLTKSKRKSLAKSICNG